MQWAEATSSKCTQKWFLSAEESSAQFSAALHPRLNSVPFSVKDFMYLGLFSVRIVHFSSPWAPTLVRHAPLIHRSFQGHLVFEISGVRHEFHCGCSGAFHNQTISRLETICRVVGESLHFVCREIARIRAIKGRQHLYQGLRNSRGYGYNERVWLHRA